MFTGIVEELGIVDKITTGKIMRLVVRAQTVLGETKIGDSIDVNGVCLTVVTIDRKHLAFDVMPETQSKANIGDLKIGDSVNLERALTAGSRLGGHIVSGHIDGKGIVRKKTKQAEDFRLEIEAEKPLLAFLVPKGSITVDGVSLTVINVKNNCFDVGIIPHTLKSTTLGFKEPGSRVNLEIDMLAKYVFRYLEQQGKGGATLTAGYLKSLGFDE